MPAPICLRDRQPRMPFSPLQTGGSIRLRQPIAAALMLTAALLVGLGASPSQAQSDYPRTTIRFIVPQAAGGSTDLVAREIGARISPALGQSIVIENRAGANGIIGTELAMKAKPDGYTMLVGGTGTLAINPSLYPKLPYDPARDFTPVAMFGYSTSVLVTHPSVPARNIAELIDWIKASSKPVLYGSAGIGSSPHLTAEMFRDMAKVNIEHVPYKGSTPSVVATIAGEVPFMFTGVSSAVAHIQSGKLKALAINGPTRSPALPEVPTANESGLPGFEAAFWIGLFAPAGTPPAIVQRLNAEINRVLVSNETKPWFLKQGMDPLANTPEQFGRILVDDVKLWSATVRSAGIKPE